MPKVIKFNASALSKTRGKGNMRIGANSHDYGTSYYSMIEPPDGGYTVYENKASGGPSIRVANNEAELINLTRESSGTTYASADECLAWFATQNDKVVVSSNDVFSNIVTDGLVLNLNASNLASYPRSGTTWYDLSGNGNNGTLTNGPTFDENGAIVFDGSNDYVETPLSSDFNLSQNSFSLEIIFYGDPVDTSSNTYRSIAKITTSSGTGQLQLRGLRSGLTGVAGLFTTTQAGAGFITTPFGSYTYGGTTYTYPGNWTYITYVFEPSNKQYFYVNGEYYAQKTQSPGFSNENCKLVLGADSNYLKGKIPFVKFYNRALTQEEILQNFAASAYPLLVINEGGIVDSDFSFYTISTIETLSSQNLYSSASLILTAAGYKAGSLYALKPLSTAITTSRSSTSIRLTNNGDLLEIATDVPNISYPYTNNKPYYLIEPGATNLLTYSNNPHSNNNNWGTRFLENVTATLYSTNGDVNILKLSENTNNGQHRISSNNSYVDNYTGTKIFTSSFYAKPNGRSRIKIYLDGHVTGYIDLEAGTTTLSTSGNSYFKKSKVTKLVNGYCYVEITFSKTNATSAAPPYYIEYLADNNNNISYQGDGTSGILMYGYQLEAMQFGTSYIKTTSTQVTRTASSRGNHLNNLQSLGILSSTGTIYIEGFYKGTSSFYQYVFGQTGQSGFNGVSFSTNQKTPSSTYSLSMRIYKSSSYIGDKTLDSSYYDGKPFKICFKYDGTNCYFFYNGISKGSMQFSGASIDKFFTGTENTAGNTTGNGSCLGINSIIMFPTDLSDNQCLTLTS